MNEREFAKKITTHLNRGAVALSDETLRRLRAAREIAMTRYTEVEQYAAAPAWIGAGSGYRGFRGYPFWIPVMVLLLALAGVAWWQVPQQANDSAADLDAALLAGDLPLDAYINHDFDKWLARSSQ